MRFAPDKVNERDRPPTRVDISSYDYVLFFVGATSGAIMLLMVLSLLTPVRALAIGAFLTIAAARC